MQPAAIVSPLSPFAQPVVTTGVIIIGILELHMRRSSGRNENPRQAFQHGQSQGFMHQGRHIRLSAVRMSRR
jgi:hypothetical protein